MRIGIRIVLTALLVACATLGCSRPRPSPNGRSLCEYALRNAACTNDALTVTGGHYSLTCNADTLDSACSPDELNTLVERFSCLDDQSYCDLAEEFKATTEATKSIKSVGSYKRASTALKMCGAKEVSPTCQTGFKEDVLNSFDLPNSPSGLPFGLIRGSGLAASANAGGTRGVAICSQLSTVDVMQCANEILEANEGHYRVTCDGGAVNKACTPKEQEKIEAVVTCLVGKDFCKNANDFISLQGTNPQAAGTQYAKTMQIFEDCKETSISNICDQSIREDLDNPFDIPNNT